MRNKDNYEIIIYNEWETERVWIIWYTEINGAGGG